MRVVVVAAALAAVLLGCAPRDPVAYAQVVCGDPEQRLVLASNEYAACVEFVAENAPSALLALGGAMLEPVRAAPDRRVN
jgi:type IV pilus biogenesis protein CpaD/CtpE